MNTGRFSEFTMKTVRSLTVWRSPMELTIEMRARVPRLLRNLMNGTDKTDAVVGREPSVSEMADGSKCDTKSCAVVTTTGIYARLKLTVPFFSWISLSCSANASTESISSEAVRSKRFRLPCSCPGIAQYCDWCEEGSAGKFIQSYSVHFESFRKECQTVV